MKRITLALALLFAIPLFGQGAHQVTLTWTASTDGGAVTVYRASGACSTSSIFTAVTTGVAVNTFVDSTVTVGSFCYEVTTVVGGAESLPSNQVTARILPGAPTALLAIPK